MIKNSNDIANITKLMILFSVFLAASTITSATDGYVLYDAESSNEITGFVISTSATDEYNIYEMKGQNDFSIFYIKSAPDTVDLYIDGEFIGFTPAKVTGLSIGEHTITFKKTGYRDYSTKILVVKGLGGKILGAMTSDNGLLAKKSWAEMTTKCNVPCKIYINNAFIGESNIAVDLDLGSYNIKAFPIDKNYHSYNTVLKLNNAENYDFNIYLLSFDEHQSADNRLIITIYSVPSGAEVIIDNLTYGVTPIGIAPISLDNHTLKLKKNGYLTKELIVEQLNDRGTRYREVKVDLEEGIDPVIVDENEQVSDWKTMDIKSKITETYASGIAKKYIIVDTVEVFNDYYQFTGERDGRLWGLFNAKYKMTIKVYADDSIKKSGPWYDFMVLDKPNK